MKKLIEDLKEYGGIQVAIIGAGKMGKGLVAQLKNVVGMKVSFIASKGKEKLYNIFEEKSDDLNTCKTDDLLEANLANKQGKIILSTNNSLAWKMDAIDVIVDCTGDTIAGAEINYNGLINGKHIVTLNVECDVLLGVYFQKLAKEKNLCYTGTAGDEPGSILELYEFAKFLGFEVLAAGKGKNNPLDIGATPEALEEKAKERGLSPRMLTSFVDATNTMIELNAVANATGLKPDVFGCHGVTANRHNLVERLTLKEEGGILNSYGVLDYVHGIAPGVFLIVKSDSPVIDDEMTFLSMGEGPNYLLYRPYHLTNIETPISIAKAVLYKEATIEPDCGYVAHTLAVAKKDIQKGQFIEGIGSDSTYGKLQEAQIAEENNYLPIGLLTKGSKAKRDIQKGEILSFDDVELEEDLLLLKLFRRQFTEK